MEYVHDRGLYVDAPMDEFLAAFKETYPKLEKFNRRRIGTRGAIGFDEDFVGRDRSKA
jgi:hypothetical protein